MKHSSQQAESMKAFIEKVSDLADVNGLPSKGFSSLLTEFAAEDLQNQLNKVFDYLILLS